MRARSRWRAMLRWGAKLLSVLVLTQVVHGALAQTSMSPPQVPTPAMPQTRMPDLAVESPPPAEPEAGEKASSWLDVGHRNIHALLWRSARQVDSWFGGQMPAHSYADETRGSITPIVLWDEFNGFEEKFRFRVRMPLPYAGDKFNAFFGTFTRDEFVTERDQASGAIPRQRAGGRVEEDQTLVGIQYRERKGRDLLDAPGGQFGADAGLRIRSPLDPFVKAGYRYVVPREGWRAIFKETAFWQNSEKFGFTSRVDLEHMLTEDWLARWSASGTISQRTEGVRGFVAFAVFRDLPNKQSIAGQLFSSAEFDADVPVEEYGIRVAYRRSIARDWFVLEVRPSLTWPKDERDQPRKSSWGLGIGFEMFFGMDEFQGRPVTF